MNKYVIEKHTKGGVWFLEEYVGDRKGARARCLDLRGGNKTKTYVISERWVGQA